MLCSHCEIGEILEDSYGAEVTLVCNNCGYVTEKSKNNLLCNSNIDTYISQPSSFHKKYQHFSNGNDLRSDTYRRNLEDMKICVDFYSQKNDAVRKAAEDMFSEMCDDRNRNLKKPLAAACAYLTLKNSNIPISVHSVANSMGVASRKLHKVLTRVRAGIDGLRPTLVESEVKLILESLPFMQQSHHLVQKAIDIYSIIQRFSLSEGRSPTTIAAACSYFALVSNEKKKPQCTAVQSFCKIHQFNHFTIKRYISVIKERLLRLMERIPWIKVCHAKKHYHAYIDDIVRYKDTLFASIEENESPASFQALLAPPSLRRQMKFTKPASRLPIASTSEVLSEVDIPESEIDMYIRSSEEVTKALNIKKLIEQHKPEPNSNNEH